MISGTEASATPAWIRIARTLTRMFRLTGARLTPGTDSGGGAEDPIAAELIRRAPGRDQGRCALAEVLAHQLVPAVAEQPARRLVAGVDLHLQGARPLRPRQQLA